jgi:hypothetical protein
MVRKVAVTAVAAAALTLGLVAAVSAQPYEYQYRVTQQTVGPSTSAAGQVYVLNDGPAVLCADPQAFRQMRIARANNNVYRANDILAQHCTRELVGTRILVTGSPQAVAMWDQYGPNSATYRVLPVRVLDGPDQGTDGYIPVSGLQ